MKFAKGVALFVVLCLAAFGAYTLLKKPPQLDVSESDISYLEDLGIHVQDGQATESGLSGVLNDVQGVAPVGASMGTPSSSAPPSIFAEPATSYADPFDAAPPFAAPASPLESAPAFDAAPRVAAVNTTVNTTGIEAASDEPQTAPPFVPEFSSPEAVVLPPPDITKPAENNAPSPEPALSEVPQFEAPPSPVVQVPPPDQSPPPTWESWDGPASDITVTPPPAEPLQSPITPSPSESFSPANEQITYQPIEKDIRRISSNTAVPRPAASTTVQDTTSVPTATYTRTSVRQPLTFSPVKPEVQPNAPMVTFGHPRRANPPQQTIEQVQSPVPAVPVNNQVQVNQSQVAPVAQPTAHTSVIQFVQSQRQLIESGDPENVRHAFIQLSQLHEHNLLGDPERAVIQPLLDSLALKVIYAKDSHILEAPYRVKPRETVESIARDFNLTPPLLRKMNGLSLSQELSPGMTLKVVYGQFDARVSTKRRELTLLLGGLYAGRFSFSLPPTDLSAVRGEFFVTTKTNRSVVLSNGWILGATDVPNATIIFNDKDAQEVFDILSEQSVVVLE